MSAQRDNAHVIEGLERGIERKRQRILELAARLTSARARRDHAKEMLGAGPPLLALGPVVSAVAGFVAALVSTCAAYAVVLGAGEPFRCGGLLAVCVAFLCALGAGSHGAGGVARAKLRSLTITVTLFSAVFLVLGIAAHR